MNREKNYIANKELTKPVEGYITRQTDERIAKAAYGRLGNPTSRVGCAVVAVYNVMLRLGKPQPYADVVRDCERLGLPWLFGALGTKPRKLGRYFRLHGVAFGRIRKADAFKAALNDCSAAIVCTWNSKITNGIHFYAVLKENGRLMSANQHYSNGLLDFDTSCIRNDRFIVGYVFR